MLERRLLLLLLHLLLVMRPAVQGYVQRETALEGRALAHCRRRSRH